MILHTLNASPRAGAFADCLRLLRPDDALLLLGDGVYAGMAATAARAQIDASGAELYVLYDDAAAAGLLAHLGDATVVDMDGFVELTERYSRQLAWY